MGITYLSDQKIQVELLNIYTVFIRFDIINHPSVSGFLCCTYLFTTVNVDGGCHVSVYGVCAPPILPSRLCFPYSNVNVLAPVVSRHTHDAVGSCVCVCCFWLFCEKVRLTACYQDLEKALLWDVGSSRITVGRHISSRMNMIVSFWGSVAEHKYKRK